MTSNQLLTNPMDYTPFGQVFTGSTNDPYFFTGKERDIESGLDYFGAQYYGSSMGRFMSPDWADTKSTSDINVSSAANSGSAASASMNSEMQDINGSKVGENFIPVPYANLQNPQTLNLYTYGRNNPLSNPDPDGHNPPCPVDACVVVPPSPSLPPIPADISRFLNFLPTPQQMSTNNLMFAQRGSGGKGERGQTAKPSGTRNPGKKARPSKTNPGRLEVQDPHDGKWKLKPPGWDPNARMDDAAKAGFWATAGAVTVDILEGVAAGAAAVAAAP